MFLDAPARLQASGDQVLPDASLDRRQQLDRFIRENEQRLFRVLMASLNDQAVALDILQDALLAFVRRYSKQSDPDDWRALIYRIVQNKLKDHFRRYKVRRRWTQLTSEMQIEDTDQTLETVDRQPRVDDQLDQQERVIQIESLIAKLPERQQQTLLLRTYGDLSEAETAAALSISIGSVKTHLSRARQNLREGFAALGLETVG